MATQRQIDSNRLNALKSTGPKTAEGKAVSRLNATTPGLAGESGHVEAKLAEAFDARREAWDAQFQPVGESANLTLDRMVAASLRLDQCDRAIDAVIARYSARAVAAWDGDRRLEAAEIASGLAKDPEVVTLKLEATAQGCAIMIGYWDRLGEAADARRPWTDAEAAIALDLLAVPRAFRDGPTAIDPRKNADVFDHRRDLAIRELTRLRAVAGRLIPFDTLDRRQAEAGDVALLTAPAQLLIRYERDAHRRLLAAVRELGKAVVAAPTPVPMPVAKPVPELPRKSSPTPFAHAYDDAPFVPMNGSSYVNISATPPKPSRN